MHQLLFIFISAFFILETKRSISGPFLHFRSKAENKFWKAVILHLVPSHNKGSGLIFYIFAISPSDFFRMGIYGSAMEVLEVTSEVVAGVLGLHLFQCLLRYLLGFTGYVIRSISCC